MRTSPESSWEGSPEANPSTSRPKSSGPPGVGSAQTSSRWKSGAISWIRQGREVWAVSGSRVSIRVVL